MAWGSRQELASSREGTKTAGSRVRAERARYSNKLTGLWEAGCVGGGGCIIIGKHISLGEPWSHERSGRRRVDKLVRLREAWRQRC